MALTGSEAELEREPTSTIPKLPLYLLPPALHSPDHPGTLTPPIYTSASVPFRWEEQPGKPRNTCTTLAISKVNDFAHKCLELPPRLLLLEGPYNVAGKRGSFQSSSSFRMTSYKDGDGSSFTPEKGRLGALVLRKGGVVRERGWFSKWRRSGAKGNREVGSGGYGGGSVFPSNGDRESREDCVVENSSGRVQVTRFERNGSFPCLSRTRQHFWGSIYEGLKQLVPWANKKQRRGSW